MRFTTERQKAKRSTGVISDHREREREISVVSQKWLPKRSHKNKPTQITKRNRIRILQLRRRPVQDCKFLQRMKTGCGGSCSTRPDRTYRRLRRLKVISQKLRRLGNSKPYTRSSLAKGLLMIKLNSLSRLLR